MSKMITNATEYLVYGKCKIFNRKLFYILSNPMMNCGTNFLNTL